MLDHAAGRRRVGHILTVPFAAAALMLVNCDASAEPADDLPLPNEPMLAEPGDWAADFNEAQLACYNGSMRACDTIWLSDRVLFDTFLFNYGRTCGGRADLRAIRGSDLRCTEFFPGYE
jgi:hypothetical protein